MKIAIMGTRGVPARYGGFETFAEELSTRLVEQGHSVTVYGRCRFRDVFQKPGNYRGVRTLAVPTIYHKYLETLIASLNSFLTVFWRRYDVIILCNAANSPFAWIPRLTGTPVLINVDGIERKRSKWNSFGKLWYRLGEICSTWFATRIIADARVIQDYYRETYQADSEVIAYGATETRQPAGAVLREFNLEADKYILYVSRLEPENNALGVIQAYTKLTTDLPLVIVGDAPYADEYKKQLKAAANANVVFTGYQFAEKYQELRSNCYLYIQATEVGGTHPALVEAMAYGNTIIANGTPENCEVLGNAGEIYAPNDFAELSAKMQELLSNSQKAAYYSKLARERAAAIYSWPVVCRQYLDLCYAVLKSG